MMRESAVLYAGGIELDATSRQHNYLNRFGALASQDHNCSMQQILRLVRRLTGQRVKSPLHTPEELECFKRDAIDNRAKHY